MVSGGGVASKPHYNKLKAFTLAETIIVLTVLGIVAMITVPSLIKHQQEVSDRTKIKKAISDYDKAIQNMVIENDLHSDTELAQWADSEDKNSCANTSAYFKVSDGNGCVFKTSDGVWWNIDNILKPIIALKQDDLDDLDNDKTFQLVTSYDANSRAFRTDDLAYETKISGEKDAMEKLFSYINNEKEEASGGEDVVDSSRTCTDEMKTTSNSCLGNHLFYCETYTSCTLTELPSIVQDSINYDMSRCKEYFPDYTDAECKAWVYENHNYDDNDWGTQKFNANSKPEYWAYQCNKALTNCNQIDKFTYIDDKAYQYHCEGGGVADCTPSNALWCYKMDPDTGFTTEEVSCSEIPTD